MSLSSPKTFFDHNIKRAIKEVEPGQIGWIGRLHELSRAIKPHVNRGRCTTYRYLLKKMDGKLMEYAERNDLSSSHRKKLHNVLEGFYEQYILSLSPHFDTNTDELLQYLTNSEINNEWMNRKKQSLTLLVVTTLSLLFILNVVIFYPMIE